MTTKQWEEIIRKQTKREKETKTERERDRENFNSTHKDTYQTNYTLFHYMHHKVIPSTKPQERRVHNKDRQNRLNQPRTLTRTHSKINNKTITLGQAHKCLHVLVHVRFYDKNNKILSTFQAQNKPLQMNHSFTTHSL